MTLDQPVPLHAVLLDLANQWDDAAAWGLSPRCVAGQHSACRHPANFRRNDGCACRCHAPVVASQRGVS